VRYYFKIGNRDIMFLDSPCVSAARTAITLIYRRDNPVAGKRALPFTCDKLVFAELKCFNTDSPADRAFLTACKFAVVCMARVSEYLPGKPGVEHWLRSDDVSFSVQDGRIIPSWKINTFPWVQIRSVIFLIRTAKNDIEGEGHRFEYYSKAPSPVRAFDLVFDMYSWVVQARPEMGEPFLMFQGRPGVKKFLLSYNAFSRGVKKVARAMGLDPVRFRPHSLRIGGASMLAAAGVPDYVIQKQGRWKSLAFLEYIRLGKKTFEMALSAMLDPSLLTVSDIERMHPGAYWREGGT